MQLPENFSFNQQNLEDFNNCRRLFYLRHLLKQEWPALESEPVREHEEAMRLGEQFHRLVYQQGIGIPNEVISASIEDPILDLWWQEYCKLGLDSIKGVRYHERLISVPFFEYRLLAKYDLVIFSPEGQAIIFDWKTSSREPQRKWFEKRMQTKVYSLVLALQHEQPMRDLQSIEMNYWFPMFPQITFRFQYDQPQFDEDNSLIQATIREIESLQPEQFTLTEHVKLCQLCRYRSLCERGEKAGDWRDLEETETISSSDFDVDFGDLSAVG